MSLKKKIINDYKSYNVESITSIKQLKEFVDELCDLYKDISIDVEFCSSSNCDSCFCTPYDHQLKVYYKREETDEEYNKRIKTLKKNKENRKKQIEKQKENELKALEKLAKKYGKTIT